MALHTIPIFVGQTLRRSSCRHRRLSHGQETLPRRQGQLVERCGIPTVGVLLLEATVAISIPSWAPMRKAGVVVETLPPPCSSIVALALFWGEANLLQLLVTLPMTGRTRASVASCAAVSDAVVAVVGVVPTSCEVEARIFLAAWTVAATSAVTVLSAVWACLAQHELASAPYRSGREREMRNSPRAPRLFARRRWPRL